MANWTIEDMLAGTCKVEDVGKKKPPALPAPTTDQEFDLPANYEELTGEELATIVARAGKAGAKVPAFKDNLLKAFYVIGGWRWLATWGKTHPNHFALLCGKMIPQEVQASFEQDKPLRIIHALAPPPGSSVRLHIDTDDLIERLRELPEHEQQRVRLALAGSNPA